VRVAGVQRTLMKTIRHRKLDFSWSRNETEWVGEISGGWKSGGNESERMTNDKYLDSLCTCWIDDVNTTQLIWDTQDRLL